MVPRGGTGCCFTPTAERDRLYETHASAMPQLGFREYPKRTKRVIPVIVLEPKSR